MRKNGNPLSRYILARLLPENQAVLTHRRIYILPGRAGLLFLLVIIILFLIAINFQNNLVYLMASWLLSVALINCLLTYRNLNGIIISAVSIEPAFAGREAVVKLDVHNPGRRSAIALELGWEGEDQATFNLGPGEMLRREFSLKVGGRGVFKPAAMTVRTFFPTGLTMAWGYMKLDRKGLVYPAPYEGDEHDILVPLSSGNDDAVASGYKGADDFAELSPYMQGESFNRISWPVYARTGSLYTRNYIELRGEECWLDWDLIPEPDTERKLSMLCSRALDLDARGLEWGYRLPGRQSSPGKGSQHLHDCLRTLALHGTEEHTF